MAKRNVLCATGLGYRNPLVSKILERLDFPPFGSNQGCPAACCHIDDFERLTIGFQVAINGGSRADIAKVNLTGKERFDFRGPSGKDAFFDLYGVPNSCLKSTRGCCVQRGGMGDVRKIRDADLVSLGRSRLATGCIYQGKTTSGKTPQPNTKCSHSSSPLISIVYLAV